MKLWRKIKNFAGCKFLVVRRDGTIPHWPYFVLGARDPAAPTALRCYADVASQNGCDPEYCQSIRELADDFERYRFEQGPGDPDAPPHRVDNPAVISAMMGGDTNLSVKSDQGNVRKDSDNV